jgi:hypothetical protein
MIDIQPQHKTVTVNVDALDRAWSLRPRYIPRGGRDNEPQKTERIERAMRDGTPLPPPRILFVKEDRGVSSKFFDGRHRFAAWRDAGNTHMNIITLVGKSERFGREAGIIVDAQNPLATDDVPGTVKGR